MALDPFVQNNPIVSALEQQRGRREQTRENAARLAKVYSRWQTVGLGVTVVEDAFDFNCTFIEEPSFQTGFAIVEDVEGAPELDIEDFPTVSSGVHKWRRDAKGYYTGAWVFFSVSANEVEYVLNHYMSWEALAMKDLPLHLMED